MVLVWQQRCGLRSAALSEVTEFPRRHNLRETGTSRMCHARSSLGTSRVMEVSYAECTSTSYSP